METNDHGGAAASEDCPRTRLSESSIAAVDVCDCGIMRLHIGALTLRLEPDAVSELLSTLGEAVSQHTGCDSEQTQALLGTALNSGGRGQA